MYLSLCEVFFFSLSLHYPIRKANRTENRFEIRMIFIRPGSWHTRYQFTCCVCVVCMYVHTVHNDSANTFSPPFIGPHYVVFSFSLLPDTANLHKLPNKHIYEREKRPHGSAPPGPAYVIAAIYQVTPTTLFSQDLQAPQRNRNRKIKRSTSFSNARPCEISFPPW